MNREGGIPSVEFSRETRMCGVKPKVVKEKYKRCNNRVISNCYQ